MRAAPQLRVRGAFPMIKVIFGKKGSGKTKRIIDMANDAVACQNGDIVFVDDDNRYMFDLRHEIRFINACEYGISSPKMFTGFIAGLIASNYDISLLFIDGFLRITNADLGLLAPFFAALAALAQKGRLDIILSISGDPDEAPGFLKEYII